jgi:hypothetical protein
MGHYFMELSDYHEDPIRKVVWFVRSVGLIEGHTRRGSTIHLRSSSAGAEQILNCPIHTDIILKHKCSCCLAVLPELDVFLPSICSVSRQKGQLKIMLTLEADDNFALLWLKKLKNV